MTTGKHRITPKTPRKRPHKTEKRLAAKKARRES